MQNKNPDKKPTVFGLITKAMLWGFILGVGITIFLYAMAYFFGETEKSFLIEILRDAEKAVFSDQPAGFCVVLPVTGFHQLSVACAPVVLMILGAICA